MPKQKTIIGVFVVIFLVAGTVAFWYANSDHQRIHRYTNMEAGFEADPEESMGVLEELFPPLPAFDGYGYSGWGSYWQPFTESERRYYEAWERSEGPIRVGIQAGHWRNDEVPDELEGLRRNGGGARGGGYSEQETVLEIANKTKVLLEAEGVVVDLLPATIAVDYYADAFVSIHADGSLNASVSGFKIAMPRRDFSGHGQDLLNVLRDEYEEATELQYDPNVTRRMSSYYAFNWRRYDHALHPLTPAVIIETGFMTSATDRAIIVNRPERAATGIARGILLFLGIIEV